MKKTKPVAPPSTARRRSKSSAGRGRRDPRARPAAKEKSDSGINTITARKLQKKDFPPIHYAVEGYIAEGVTLLGGKPKIGKSWMVLNLAMAIAKGGLALGSIQCTKGTVLYCALEDNERRLQRRMHKLYGDEERWPSSFHFTTQMERLDKVGIEDLRDWIAENEPVLVIIDTLACVKPQTKRDGSGYEADYAALSPLQELAGELGVCIIVVHHLRKMHGDDPLDMVSGTTGLTGAVDTILVLNRDTHGVTLYGRGREIEEIETALEFRDGTWKILGPASEVRRSEERQAILNVLADAGKPMTLKAISNAMEIAANNVKQLLFKMALKNEVQRVGRGKYALPEN